MGLAQLVKAIYSNRNRPLNSRQIVLPDETNAIGATVTAGNNPVIGDWIDVALPAAVTTDTLVIGVVVDAPSAAMVLSIDIGSTWAVGVNYADATAVITAGATQIAAAHRAWIRIEVILIAAAVSQPVMLPFPVWIPNASGILARGYTVGGAETINVSVICLQDFE